MSKSFLDNGDYTQFSLILRASSIEGVGVFATHTLRSGVELFTGWEDSSKIYSEEEAQSLGELKKYLCRYGSSYIGPAKWDNMHLSWFLNHSKNPNIAATSGVMGKYYTLREIQKGEELSIDYNSIDAIGDYNS
jgi:SET domain-containing protein